MKFMAKVCANLGLGQNGEARRSLSTAVWLVRKEIYNI
jgi:hypothetical protein